MILLESKDLSPPFFVSFFPLTFWPWGEFDIFFSLQGAPEGLVLAGQLKTFLGRGGSWTVKSWMTEHSGQVMDAPFYPFGKRLSKMYKS